MSLSSSLPSLQSHRNSPMSSSVQIMGSCGSLYSVQSPRPDFQMHILKVPKLEHISQPVTPGIFGPGSFFAEGAALCTVGC